MYLYFYLIVGCENLHSHCGVYACDPEGYDTFADILYPVIKDYHKVSDIKHPKPDFGDLSKLGFDDLDPKNEYILSTRVRVGRSHAAFAFPPVSSKEVYCVLLFVIKSYREKKYMPCLFVCLFQNSLIRTKCIQFV
jgi:hypothetical protein